MCGGGRHPLRCCTAIYIYNIISTQVQRWSPELSCRLRTRSTRSTCCKLGKLGKPSKPSKLMWKILIRDVKLLAISTLHYHQWYSMRQSIQDIINKGREKIKMKKQMNDTQYVQHS